MNYLARLTAWNKVLVWGTCVLVRDLMLTTSWTYDNDTKQHSTFSTSHTFLQFWTFFDNFSSRHYFVCTFVGRPTNGLHVRRLPAELVCRAPDVIVSKRCGELRCRSVVRGLFTIHRNCSRGVRSSLLRLNRNNSIQPNATRCGVTAGTATHERSYRNDWCRRADFVKSTASPKRFGKMDGGGFNMGFRVKLQFVICKQVLVNYLRNSFKLTYD